MKGKNPFKRNICTAAFSQTQHLNEQTKAVYEGKKPFKYNVCEAAFSQQQSMNGHIESFTIT